MKRALTKRGYAMLQSGSIPLAQLLEDPNFSVEIAEGMEVTNKPINVSVQGPASEDPAEPSAKDPASEDPTEPSAKDPASEDPSAELTTKLSEMTDSYNSVTTKLTESTTALAAMTSEAAGKDAKIEELTSLLTSARPLMESAIHGIQMRMRGNVSDLSDKKETELFSLFADVTKEFTSLFPNGQVSVVSTDEPKTKPLGMDNTGLLSVYQRANRHRSHD